jgi:glycosyltransferase involved in cell wall biosynthesis
MRIAYVCTDPGVPVFGSKGGSIHLQEVLRGMIARGHKVVLCARRIGGEVPQGLESVTLRRLSKAPSGQTEKRERFLLEANDDLRATLASEPGLDMVYERHALWSFAAMEFAQNAGLPGLLEVNAPLVEEQQRFRSLERVEQAEAAATRCIAAAGALLAVSRPLAAWLETCDGAAGRVHVVQNGVDISRFGSQVVASQPAAGLVTIGFLGSLRPWHGVEQLGTAFLQLRQQGSSVRLLIVGDGPMRAQIERQCASEADSVVMTGAVEPERVPGLLASMDIAVAPYPRMESFYFSPLKLYEYMAAGVAIVASASGQVCDVIENRRTGLLYEPDDGEALCAALGRLVGDAGMRSELGANARGVADREHRWEHVVGRILGHAERCGKAAV